MATERVERRLAAVLAADVAGYSRLMGADEVGTLAALKALRREVVDPAVVEHKGRIVKTTGDGMLVEFASAVDAVTCAMAVQEKMAERTAAGTGPRIQFRVGINIGDIIIDGDDIFGDGVNVAARVENECEPGCVCLSGSAFEQVRGKTSFMFDDLGEKSLKNIDRPVRLYAVKTAVTPPTATAKSPAEVGKPLPLPDKPSIAVLPFQNMSGDPEQDYFADGMVEEIITALSRIRWLFVIARNSSFTYKGRAVDVKEVGRELGVRYVLEGSVRKAGQRVRITAQLIDAANSAHLWADRFDDSMEDIFELQDKVALNVAGVIGPAVQAAEIHRLADRPTNDLAAYDLYLRAIAPVRSGEREKESYLQGLDLATKAVKLDPRYGSALAFAAFCHVVLHTAGWTDDADANRREAIDLAHRALAVAGNDPEVLGLVARVLGYFSEDIAAAIALIDRALELNPSFALGWHWSAWLRLWAGEPDVGIRHMQISMRFNPLQSRGDSYIAIGMGHFFSRRFEDAAATLLLALQEHPKWVPTYRFLASCYAHMGRLDEARETARRLRMLTADVVPSATHWRNPEHRELYLSGLRLAVGE
jgi:adenylate cyclase